MQIYELFHSPQVFFQIFSMKMLQNQKIVVSLQTVGRGQRNEKQMDYQDVRDGPVGTTPPAITERASQLWEAFFIGLLYSETKARLLFLPILISST